MSRDHAGRSRSDTGITSSSGYSEGADVVSLEQRIRGWGLRRRSQESSEDIKGPLGLHLLHLSNEPLIDFIFVHGLRGGSVRTWKKGNDAQMFWPQHWLPLEPALKNVSVHTFGYNADWGDTKDSFLNVHDFGKALLGEITTSPCIRKGGANPIVLIGHSMGGLVIKKAYILARQDVSNPLIAQRIRCAFFLATPHRGSDSAPLLNNLLRASGTFSARHYITDLEKNSFTTQTINDEFRHLVDELILYSFYETAKTNLGLSSAIIVDRDSAILGYKHERVQYLNANHREICKYDSPNDPNYITVKNALATAVEELLRGNFATTSEKYKAEMRVVQTYLDVSDIPDNDLNVGVKGTCNWIDSQADFEAWRDGPGSTPSDITEPNSWYYWVSAKPATGKSFLSAHVVRHLRGLRHNCSYYYFRYGSKSRQKLSGLLLSLAHQMAVMNATVRQKLLELVHEEIKFDKDDERAIWRKVFVGGIFLCDISTPQFWVIDGLDECINHPVLFTFMAQIEAGFPLRIFITSRIHPDMEKQFSKLGRKVVSTGISLENTYHDIEVFLRSKWGDLPIEKEDERKALSIKILAKSGGCFLWVRLVLQELEHIYDISRIETVLDQMPAEMNQFYDRTIEIMSKEIREKEVAKAFLRWAVIGTRSLRTAEIQYALNIDIGANVRSIEKSIGDLCGQLIVVDKNGAVQMVHQTARDFLLGDKKSEFGIDIGLAHEKAAIACLKFLCGSEMKPPKHWRQLEARRKTIAAFQDYACTSFSDHVFAASSEQDNILSSLDIFLKTNVLSWIEYIAQKGSLYLLNRTAKNLKGYLGRRAKYRSPLGQQVLTVDAWVTDLVRLAAKFGPALINDPASIYFLIPPLCPTESAVFRHSARSHDALVLAGIANTSWEDCISCIDFTTSRATTLACGDNVFAIGMRSGNITLYSQATLQVERSFQHLEPVKVLKFDSTCKFFVSAGWKSIKFWDRNGGVVWTQRLTSPCISIAFNSHYIVGITKTSHIIYWSVKDGEIIKDRFYRYREPNDTHGDTPHMAPLASDFSPDLEMVAFAYRSPYVCLWDLENDAFIGCCSRPAEDGSEGTSGLAVGTVLFNPNPDISLIAVGYQDGDLAIFDQWSQGMITTVEANALSLASSPDGRTLAAGDACGTVQLWDFETLTLLYKIQSYDFEVKALAFSGDGLRLIDIRDSRSKIWEPSILVRKSIEEDVSVSSEAAPTPAVTVGLDYFNQILNITALTAHPTLPVIFVGKSDGCVAVHDSLTGFEKCILYSHPKDVFVTEIACHQDYILASADAGGTVQVWRLEITSPGSWGTRSQLLSTNPKQSIRQLVFSHQGEYLLVSAASSASVWSITTGSLIGSAAFEPAERTVWKWFSSSSDMADLSLIVDDQMLSYSWHEFPRRLSSSNIKLPINASLISNSIEIQNALSDTRSKHLILDFRKHYGNKATEILLILDYDLLLPNIDEIKLDNSYSVLSNKIRYFVGISNSRLIFIDKYSWLVSVELGTFSGKEYVQHFFVPHEVVAGNTGVMAVLTESGDVAFAKEGQLAVVRNGTKFRKVVEINA